MIPSKQITRIFKIGSIFVMMSLFLASKGFRCASTPSGPSEPPPSDIVYCELDAMIGYKPLYSTFQDELRTANADRSMAVKEDSTYLDQNPEYLRGDTIPDLLEQYLIDHRSIVDTLTAYDNRVYLCGVRRIVIPTQFYEHDSPAPGCTYVIFTDTTVHNEGKSVIAVETIIDSCASNGKPYANHEEWAVAHELGHQFNLPYPLDHCTQSDCMMWFGWSAYGAYKTTFCDSCRSRLSWSHP